MTSFAASGSCLVEDVATVDDANTTGVVLRADFGDLVDLMEDFAEVEAERRQMDTTAWQIENLMIKLL